MSRRRIRRYRVVAACVLLGVAIGVVVVLLVDWLNIGKWN